MSQDLELTDEILMAYADNELSLEERQKVDAILSKNPNVQKKLALYQVTGKNLGKAYTDVLEQPLPQPLIDLVKGNTQVDQKETILRKATSFGKDVINSLFTPAPAYAVALALTIGAGSSFLLFTPQTQTNILAITQNDGQVYATSLLHDILEETTSEKSRTWYTKNRQKGFIVALNTFLNKKKEYCREYEVAIPNVTSSLGVACRKKNGQWSVKLHVAHAPPPKNDTDFQPASGPGLTSINKFIEDTMLGKPLNLDIEAKAIKKGWK